MTATVTLHQDGAISVVTLNRPHRLNAMNEALLRELYTQLETAQADLASGLADPAL